MTHTRREGETYNVTEPPEQHANTVRDALAIAWPEGAGRGQGGA
jgi:hypothetical protein